MHKHYLRPFTMLATSLSALAVSCAGDPSSPPMDGKDAAPLLTKSSALEGTEDCSSGGVKVEMGSDTDGDGKLDDNEVTSETILCNGEDGTSGTDGSNGEDGTNGKNGSGSLVRVSDLSSGAECPSGGYLVEAGLDNGDGDEVAGDGVLGDGEVDSESYACSGVDGFSVLSLLTADVSGTCVHGGYRLDVGLDNGDGDETSHDGTLSSGEIDSSAYLCNGDDGTDGENGTNGTDGEDGTNGTDGEDGTNGTDGLTALVKTSSEGAGANCEFGGTRIESGLDDSDDGVLDPGEVDATAFACDGEDGENGTDGSNGQDGDDGANGLKALVLVSSEGNGSNCTNGGTRIDVGLDDDNNGTLDSGEIDSTSYVCDGADGAPGQDGDDGAPGQDGDDGAPGQDGEDGTNGTNGTPGQDGDDGATGPSGHNALVKQTAISAEGTCSGAGIRVDSGIDADDDNTLDPGEIQATQYLCEGGGGSSGLKVVDANGDVLGDALSSDATGVTVRTSTGHITVLGWDGTPVPLKYVDFTGASCTGDAKIYVDLGGASIHEKSAYWSEFHSAFLVPSGTPVGGVIAPVSGSYVSYYQPGLGCTAFSDTALEWPSLVRTSADIGLGMTIDAPLSLQ